MTDQESPFRDREPIATPDALELLRSAEIEILGRMPFSSNATFLVDLEVGGEVRAQAIYKPHRGEQPLWDFPDGLYRREIAAFALSEQLGWNLVPPTIEVEGPVGVGSLQLFIPADFEQHYFTLVDDRQYHDTFRRLALFDFASNNTDRKSGHVLLGQDGDIWAIDNGLSFHAEFKLRTVIWDFAGEPIDDDMTDPLWKLLDDGVSDDVARNLGSLELDALKNRVRVLATEARFPDDPTGRRWPWPMV